MNDLVCQRIQACFAGIYIGDPLGMAWEMKTPEEILAETGGQGVTGFSEPSQKYFLSKAGWKLGWPTDDWQLTAAVANAIIAAVKDSGADDGWLAALQNQMVAQHIAERNNSTVGWGKSSKNGIDNIIDGLRDPGEPLPVPKEPNVGTGNGVAMKVSPLALFHSLVASKDPRLGYLVRDVFDLGLLTHGDRRASISAYALALLMVKLVRTPIDSPATGMQETRRVLLPEVQRIESLCLRDRWQGDALSDRLERALQSSMLTDPVKLRQTTGTSCFCLESIPFVIATFLRWPTDFRQGVLEAVNAGGDTDSNAAMVGALIGLNSGLEAIPREWLERVEIPPMWLNDEEHCKDPMKVGERLYQAGLAMREIGL